MLGRAELNSLIGSYIVSCPQTWPQLGILHLRVGTDTPVKIKVWVQAKLLCLHQSPCQQKQTRQLSVLVILIFMLL